LTDNEVSAEIAKLTADTVRIHAETMRLLAETRRLNEEAPKISAETRNLSAHRERVYAETRKLEREARWFPFQVVTGVIAAVFAIFAAAAGFLKFIDWFKP
jgi:uncharacterized protein (DUF3084 family)